MNNNKNIIQRNSNIELLRIIAMIMIVGHHFVLYGVQQDYNYNIAGEIFSNGNIINKLFAVFMLPGGVVGANGVNKYVDFR